MLKFHAYPRNKMGTVYFVLFLNLFSIPSSRLYTQYSTPPTCNIAELEDQYIKQFGNHNETQFWDMARAWNLEHREPRLKRFCKEAHKQAGYNAEAGANNTQVRPRVLVFENPKYEPRMVDIMMYGINGISQYNRDRFFFWLWRDDYWYMTEAERDDCVYYVTHANKTMHTFKLIKHVCGIFIDYHLERGVAYF